METLLTKEYRVMEVPSKFKKELTNLINKYSLENASNTPDYILTNYLLDCLTAYNAAVKENKQRSTK